MKNRCYTPLIIIKQAILVWSLRQNIFPACFLQKSSISTRGEIAVTKPPINFS